MVDWAFWAQEVDCATERHMALTAADCYAAAVATKHEYDTSRRNASVDLFGAATLNAKCAIIGERSMCVTKAAKFIHPPYMTLHFNTPPTHAHKTSDNILIILCSSHVNTKTQETHIQTLTPHTHMIHLSIA